MKYFLISLIAGLLIYSCEETEVLNETGKMQVTDIHLPQLPDGYHYEAWLLVDGSYVSVGNITNDSISNNIARFSEIEVNDLETAQSFAITIETNGSAAPSNYVLLTGNFDGNTANLSPDNEVVNGVQSIARRISAAYTVQNATVPEEEQSNYGTNGIWFFKGSGENTEPVLELDYDEMAYQAWLVKSQNNVDQYLNMGRIISDTLADNYKSFTLFTNNTPDFPGEDFLTDPDGGVDYPEGFFPLDVRGAKLILTPIPTNYDNATNPFPVFLLEATIPNDVVRDTELTRNLEVNTDFGAIATKL